MTPKRVPASTARRALVVAFAAIVGAFTVGTGIAQAQSTPPRLGVVAAQAAAISDCSLSDLPSQAGDTVDLIHSGGPFPYPDKDGTVFDNREGLLPSESDGYYHEYTVPTPGSPDRGARRIVTGGSPLTDPAHYYYTGDHYESFCEISDAGNGGGGVPACTSVPSQVGDTVDLVEAGGPFDYPQDGEVYQNREGVLPDESAGYYHLYVVPTPGTDGDGDRRLITGSDGEYYYTPDDYTTFCVL